MLELNKFEIVGKGGCRQILTVTLGNVENGGVEKPELNFGGVKTMGFKDGLKNKREINILEYR